MKRFTLITAITLAVAFDGFSQWGPSDCGPVGPFVSPVRAQPAQPKYKWWGHKGEPTSRAFLYRRNTLIGRFDYETGEYYRRCNEGWEKESNIPFPPNPKWNGHEYVTENFGLMPEKMNSGPEAFYMNGVRIEKSKAYEAVASLPDDSNKLRLLMIGSEQETKPVMSVVPQDIRSRAICQSVPRDHWWLKDNKSGQPMYATDAKEPMLYLLEPDGKVRHRQKGVKDLPKTFDALRQGIKDYDAKKDPNYLNEPKIKIVDRIASNYVPWGLAGVMGIALVWLNRSRIASAWRKMFPARESRDDKLLDLLNRMNDRLNRLESEPTKGEPNEMAPG